MHRSCSDAAANVNANSEASRTFASEFYRKGGTASLRSCTRVKRNAVFGARSKGISLLFVYQNGNLIRIKTGLDTHLIGIHTRTPPCQVTPPMIILIVKFCQQISKIAK